jgi:hypothetical protein
MTVLSIIAFIIGLTGIAFGLECYRRLHEWARLCQHGRIFIAYNNKVKLDAPITEWVQWTRMLKEDEASTGRVIYQANKLRVGIFRPKKTITGTTVKTVTDSHKQEAVA